MSVARLEWFALHLVGFNLTVNMHLAGWTQCRLIFISLGILLNISDKNLQCLIVQLKIVSHSIKSARTSIDLWLIPRDRGKSENKLNQYFLNIHEIKTP